MQNLLVREKYRYAERQIIEAIKLKNNKFKSNWLSKLNEKIIHSTLSMLMLILI